MEWDMAEESYNMWMVLFMKENLEKTFVMDTGIIKSYFRILYLNGKQIYEGNWERDKIFGYGVLKNIHFINKKKLS
jgi:hypothetical protein